MAELTEYAMMLNTRGIEVDIDRIDEPLAHLTLNGKQDEPEAPEVEPIMGFVDTDPEKFKNEDTGMGQRLRLRGSMANNLERSLSNL